MTNKEHVANSYQTIQDEICVALEQADAQARFEGEIWKRDGGGGGRTRIIQNGAVIERGGVNFSAVYGKLPEAVKKAFKVEEENFYATGISIVIHPHNPWVPIIHMNIRYFELNEETRWFGGGIDLTPHYVVMDDAKFFHGELKKICDQYNLSFYSRFKKWADDYFFIKHRQETRGIGGIFYDRLQPMNTDLTYTEILNFSIQLGKSFAPIYTELITRNNNKAFTKENKDWQLMRRSRYVEFNLVYDSGTKFGLETNGRIESILMSLPPEAKWSYNYKPTLGTPEAETLDLLKKGINWI